MALDIKPTTERMGSSSAESASPCSSFSHQELVHAGSALDTHRSIDSLSRLHVSCVVCVCEQGRRGTTWRSI